MDKKIEICLFSSYFQGFILPDYVKIYLTELSKYCKRIILITTFKPGLVLFNPILKKYKIKTYYVKNEGFDFGMWYKALKNFDLINSKSILFANDSCVLINPLSDFFNWQNQIKTGLIGLTSSNEQQYHIQSYFFVLKEEAIPLFYELLLETGINQSYYAVVKNLEIGLTQKMVEEDIECHAYVDFGRESQQNPMFFNLLPMFENRFPLIKRQLLWGFSRKSNIQSLRKNNFTFSNLDIKNMVIQQSDLGKNYKLDLNENKF